nr:integrase, catalytic region, zinc finger, CCHC-type, peptidase aspartic, catalytic [Tanacetum cinerariifolium]
MILSGAYNRPPMLDKDLYDSWKSIIKLYMQNREHERMTLESIENGPLIWHTVEENGVARTKKYVELSFAKKIQADCDMKATNIILQEVPDSETYLNDMENQSYQNSFYLKKAQRIKTTLYNGIVIFAKHVAMHVTDDEETLILEEESRSKMSKKEKDPEAIKQNISHKPIDYEKLNRLTEYFGKRFTLQQDLSAKQAFWLPISNPTIESSNKPSVIIEVPSKLPKVRLMNSSLKKLKFHLTQFNSVVKKRSTPDARTEGGSCYNQNALEILEFFKNNALKAQVQDKDSTICKLKEIIKSMREKFKEENVNYVYYEIETKNVELENSVAKLLSENERLCKEINHVKQCFKDQFDSIKKTSVRAKEQSDSLIDKLNLKCTKNEDLKAQMQDKGIVKQAKAKQPLDKEIDFSCRTFTIVGNSCPLTRITSANVVPSKKTTFHSIKTQKPALKVYNRKPKNVKNVGLSKKAKIVESKNANHSRPNHNWESNAIDILSSFSLVMTGVDLLSGSRDTNLYTISLDDMLKTSPIYLLSKASKTKSWLWHHRLSHLNFSTLNKLAKDGPRLHSMTPVTSSSGLVPNTVSQQPCILPNKDDWDHLFQSMFDEFFNPPSIDDSPLQEAAAPRAVVLPDSSVSTSIDQDAPSTIFHQHKNKKIL